MTRIALLRHFPTYWNEEGRLQGRTDVPLTPAARAELARLRLPGGWRGLPIVASPLARARETARALSEGAAFRTEEHLVEMDFGEWEGQIGAELLADPACAYRPVEEWGWDFRPPGGESPREMAARLRPLLAELAWAGPHVIVTHRGVMRCLLALASGWAYAGPPPFAMKRAALHEITLGPDGMPIGPHSPIPLERR
ncbi:MAG TPA: histidine phosphatase family protein [Paracoccaceae bacterium]|nr:histidine phosphatase family protein [Paracoccaceae bacterium]